MKFSKNAGGRLVSVALVLLGIYSCGDDAAESGQGDGGGETADAGAVDSGGLGNDGGDASSELAQALKAEGIRIDDRRVELVVTTVCQNARTCENKDPAECHAVYEGDWALLGTSGATIECRDAHLDYTGCLAGVDCDHAADCDPLDATVVMLCGDDRQ